jgi:hypothetical protein
LRIDDVRRAILFLYIRRDVRSVVMPVYPVRTKASLRTARI